jgi:hypothetical protein
MILVLLEKASPEIDISNMTIEQILSTLMNNDDTLDQEQLLDLALELKKLTNLDMLKLLRHLKPSYAKLLLLKGEKSLVTG